MTTYGNYNRALIFLNLYQPIASADQLQKTALLAAVFTLGFVTLNWALGIMHVSLVMTLRATEPMFTLLLASLLLRAEPVTWNQIVQSPCIVI